MNVTGYFNHSEIRSLAEPVPGNISQNLLNLAAEEDIVVLAGMAERSASDDIYASHLVVHPDGNVGVYRKLHIAPPEKKFLTAGTDIPLFKISGYTFGIQLCYDAHFPELATQMAIKGADVIFLPHASPRGNSKNKFKSWMRHLPARAFDNGLYIVACNQTGDNDRGLSFPGLALAIDPSGDVLAKKIDGNEKILIVDLKQEALKKVRHHDMRYFLPNRRSDIYG
jgi:N-carbamoylputrescine amidase